MNQESDDRDSIIYEALKRVDANERKAYLELACGTDTPLRADIESLLSAYEDDTGCLKAPAELFKETIDTASETPGTMIGRYKLLEKIGEGGFGAIWAAEQRRPVKRRVALKIIKLGMDTRQVVARFEAERQALALMDHPNIAKVLDAGSTDAGRPYFVMELVRGIPITDYCDQEACSTQKRLDLFMKVCHAIQHAHQKGIIHRDIKPSNILITLHDGIPVPRVIDFGIAKATQQELTEKTIYTQHHQFIGTPAYMSPEQAEMSGLDIDTRSDIYSLGVLLYELLTGKTPFDEKELLESGIDQMRKIIREKEPVRPSTRLSQVNSPKKSAIQNPQSKIDNDLDWIVMKCLEKDRTRRYDTANDIATDIHRHLTDEPIVARPPSTIYQLQKAWRRNKVVYTAGGLVVLALAVGLGLAALGLKRAVAAQKLEAEQREKAQANEKKASEAQASEAKLRRRADHIAHQARLNLYAADMTLAQHSLRQNNLGRACRLLDRHRPQPGEEDLRGWEWRYLWQLTRGSPHVTLIRRAVRGWDVSLSPDGSRLAVGWADGRVDLWDVAAQRLTRSLMDGGNLRGGAHVAFSPVRNLLAATSESKGVKLYDLDSGRESSLWQAPEQSYRVTRLAFSQDGSKLVIYAPSGSTDISDEVWVVDVSSPQIESRHLTGYGTWTVHYGGAQLSPDGRRLYLARIDQEEIYSIQCIDLDTKRELWQTKWLKDGGLSTLALSPDGRLLASGSGFGDATIRVWDAATGQLLRPLLGHTHWVCNLVFSEDGRELISAASDQTIRWWDTGTWTETRVLRGHRDEVHAVAISKPAHVVASASKDGALTLWNTGEDRASDGIMRLPEGLSADQVKLLDHSRVLLLPPGRPPEWLDLKRENAPVSLPGLGPSSNVLGCFGGHILCRWNETDQILIHEWRGDAFVSRGAVTLDSGARPIGVAYNVPHAFLAWAETASSNSVYLTELTTLDRRVELRSDVPGLIPIRFSEQGTHLLGRAGEENIWRVWHIETGKIVASVEGVSDAVFAADGCVLVTTGIRSDGQEIAFYDLANPNGAFRRIPERFHCGPLRVSPDGALVAGPTRGGEVRLFDPAKGELVASLHGHMNGANNVAFSPDGRRLISIGSAGQIKLWDVDTRQELLTLSGAVDLGRWTADGQAFFVGARQAWRAPSFESINAIEAQQRQSERR